MDRMSSTHNFLRPDQCSVLHKPFASGLLEECLESRLRQQERRRKEIHSGHTGQVILALQQFVSAHIF